MRFSPTVLLRGVLGTFSRAHKLLAKRVMQRERINWPTWWCPPSLGSAVVDDWDVNGYPEMVVIDHKGIIRWRNSGALNAQECADLDQLIDELVAQCARDTKKAGRS